MPVVVLCSVVTWGMLFNGYVRYCMVCLTQTRCCGNVCVLYVSFVCCSSLLSALSLLSLLFVLGSWLVHVTLQGEDTCHGGVDRRVLRGPHDGVGGTGFFL